MAKNEKIRNGNRYIQEAEGTGVFARDTDRLFLEYTNLRMSLYNKYQDNFKNEETKNELMSYINEEFIKLVKEYEINSPVDFPGYVKSKLTARVSQGFVRGKYKDKGREIIMREDGAVQEVLENEGVNNLESLEMKELLEHVFGNGELTDLEQDIVTGWLMYQTDRQITKEVAPKYDLSNSAVKEHMRILRKEVRNKIENY